MDKFMEFWALHGSTITNFLILIGGSGLTYFVSKLLGKSTNKLLNYSLGMVSQLFGGGTNIDEIKNNVQELPFVKDLSNMLNELRESQELRLINLKRLINNRKLTAEERLVYEHEFKVLFNRLGRNLLPETLELLDKLDNINKEV